MRLEISIPDGITWVQFKNAAAPEGVTIRVSSPPQQYSLDVSINVSVVLDVAATVKSIAVAGLILSAFKHYLRKYPNAFCRINRKEIRLEQSEIVRCIEEVRAEEHLSKPSNANRKITAGQSDEPSADTKPRQPS